MARWSLVAVVAAMPAVLPAGADASWSDGGYLGVGEASGCVSFGATDSGLIGVRVGGCHWQFVCGPHGSRGAPGFFARRIRLPRSGHFSRHREDPSSTSATLIWDVEGTVSGTRASGTFRFHYGPVCDTGVLHWQATRLVKMRRTCNSAGLALGRARASAHCKLRHKVLAKEFSSCADAGKYINAHPNGIPEAQSSFPLDPKLMPGEEDGNETATVSWKLGPDAEIAEPKFRWPKMTGAETKALTAWEAAVSTHEHGHLKIAEDFVSEEGEKRFSAPSATELNEKLEAYRVKTKERLQERSDKYDRVTRHGANQSAGPKHDFPGGADSVLSCP